MEAVLAQLAALHLAQALLATVIVVAYLQRPRQQHLNKLDLCLSLPEAGRADQAGTLVFAAVVVSRPRVDLARLQPGRQLPRVVDMFRFNLLMPNISEHRAF